jgi:tRNA-binding EMAP/Myf-like protein
LSLTRAFTASIRINVASIKYGSKRPKVDNLANLDVHDSTEDELNIMSVATKGQAKDENLVGFHC